MEIIEVYVFQSGRMRYIKVLVGPVGSVRDGDLYVHKPGIDYRLYSSRANGVDLETQLAYSIRPVIMFIK